jgi:hypothetical protein
MQTCCLIVARPKAGHLQQAAMNCAGSLQACNWQQPVQHTAC